MKQNQVCPVPTGKLLLIGGAEDKTAKINEAHKSVLTEFVKLCGKNPTIEIITTAGSESVGETYREYSECFLELGAKATGHIHHQTRPSPDAEEMRRFADAQGVFFSGGDQLKLTAVYGGTEIMVLLKERYIGGGLVISGTSAGAMAMSTPMIFEGNGEKEMVAAGVKVTTGFEFLKDVCVDTHFVHRGRFVRMAQVIATNPACIGIGIEEDTAILVTGGIKARVVGSGVVIIIDGRESSGSNITSYDNDKRITIRDLKTSILSKDEEFEIPVSNPSHL
jgi:cyanophycinase